MEDKKVLEFVNNNHEKSYNEYVKSVKKNERKSTICCITLILAILSLVLVFGSVIHQETQKSVKMCLKNGYSYNECLKDF